MDLALGTDASKSDAKDPVRFSALLGGPGTRVVFVWHFDLGLKISYQSGARSSRYSTAHCHEMSLTFSRSDYSVWGVGEGRPIAGRWTSITSGYRPDGRSVWLYHRLGLARFLRGRLRWAGRTWPDQFGIHRNVGAV